MFHRYTIILCVLLLPLTVVVPNASGEVQYNLTDLGRLPEGSFSWAFGINDSGQIVGWADYNGGSNSCAFLWQNSGGMQYLSTLELQAQSAAAINNNGQVVGAALTATNSQCGFLWQVSNGMTAILPLPGDSSCHACNINNNGQVVGRSNRDYGQVHTQQAIIWESGQETQCIGTLPGYSYSSAVGINDSGQVVGTAINNSGVEQAFLWQSTVGIQTLGTLGGSSSGATAINGPGQVVGTSQDSTGSWRAFLWQSATGMQDLGLLPGYTRSTATDINANGKIVGYLTATSGNDGFVITEFEHAFIWDANSGMVELNTLIDPSLGWTLTYAEAINDNGWIVGSGYGPDGHPNAFLLTPVPEPCDLVFLCIGTICFLGHTWRQQKRLPLAR